VDRTITSTLEGTSLVSSLVAKLFSGNSRSGIRPFILSVFEDPSGLFSFAADETLLPLTPNPEGLKPRVFEVEGLFSLSSSIFFLFTLTTLFLPLVLSPFRIGDDGAAFNTDDVTFVEAGLDSARIETRGLRLGEDC